MSRLRAFLDRLPGGHRPPRGPLTIAEQGEADELRQETIREDEQRAEREQEAEDPSAGKHDDGEPGSGDRA
jgi:hypothetical protein